MTQKEIKNIGVSVRQRLLNHSRDEGISFNEVLEHYAIDRFLYRLSQSPYADRFILKGGLMFKVWSDLHERPTKDVDLLGKMSNDLNSVLSVLRDATKLDNAMDGIEFLSEAATAEDIVKDGDYKGVRVKLPGLLAKARLTVQIDVGFGDSVYPYPEMRDLPTVLDQPPTHLACYCKETVIAEKYHAMVELAERNSRMKDFYDIWFLCNAFGFDGERLCRSIALTFEKRGTIVPVVSEALQDEFHADVRQVRWSAFARRMSTARSTPPMLDTVLSDLRAFLGPVGKALATGHSIGTWTPGEGWKE
jgi:predicted nucleotidyltransferase component of viral defense system